MQDGRRYLIAGAALAAAISGQAAMAQTADCAALKDKSYEDIRILNAINVTQPLSVKSMDPPIDVDLAQPFCRIEGVATPSPDSDIRFEVWLPPPDVWNGRYQGIGNGGYAGSLIYTGMRSALQAGYATAGTDTGHAANYDVTEWAKGQPEKVSDFGWRSIHLTAKAAKAVIADYYGTGPKYSYFNGCSNGGRQALMEAQRFPDDYDGIVAGAPANNWTGLMAGMLNAVQAQGVTPESWLAPADLKLISDSVRQSCGSEHGYVQNPASCGFEPATLTCQPDQTGNCLKPAQVQALEKIYAGVTDQNGNRLYPGYVQGSEDDPLGWALWLTGTESKRLEEALATGFVDGFFRDIFPSAQPTDPVALTPAQALQIGTDAVGSELNSVSTDLSAFKARGGKLIQYHGWDDSAIPAQSSIDYWRAVAADMGGAKALDDFYRLFMAPGMQHCADGPGPNAVGAIWGLPAPEANPEHDIMAALDRWVTDGVAPERIVATKYHDNDASKGIERQAEWPRQTE